MVRILLCSLNIEKLLLTCEVYKEQFFFFKKAKILLISNTHLYWLDYKKKYLRKKDKIKDLLAVTKSLIMDQTNFIIHYKNRGQEELYSEK